MKAGLSCLLRHWYFDHNTKCKNLSTKHTFHLWVIRVYKMLTMQELTGSTKIERTGIVLVQFKQILRLLMHCQYNTNWKWNYTFIMKKKWGGLLTLTLTSRRVLPSSLIVGKTLKGRFTPSVIRYLKIKIKKFKRQTRRERFNDCKEGNNELLH